MVKTQYFDVFLQLLMKTTEINKASKKSWFEIQRVLCFFRNFMKKVHENGSQNIEMSMKKVHEKKKKIS